MPVRSITASLGAVLLAGTTLPAAAEPLFDRVATMMVRDNLPSDADPKQEAVAEIISASQDGMTLVYTDAPGGRIGFVDLADPARPMPAGVLAVGGEPTSVKIVGETAYVAVDTSESFTEPAGKLVTVSMADKTVVRECALPGQPDSVAASRDGAFLAIAVENQRDEDVDDGAIPQLPAGNLLTVALGAGLDCAALRTIGLAGIAEVAGEDPEPEFVDVNDAGEVVVTLQENNHVVIVDGATGAVKRHFSAGTVSLDGIDTQENGAIELSGSRRDVPREPDGVAWLGEDRIVTANEGDWKGGTRGFTIFNRDGSLAYDSGAALEHEMVALGHYPEGRDEKGIEIEGVAVGAYRGETLIFAGSERGSAVAVYRDTGGDPALLQVLPGGIGPEGLLAIPSRNLFVTATETDLHPDGGIGAQIVVYERAERTAPAYPTIRSAAGENGLPIAWGALSGLAADRALAGRLYAVTDSVYGGAPRILTIDAAQTPATIIAAATVTREGAAAGNLDLEGIAAASDGGFWLASEGDGKGRGNLLLRVDAAGAIREEIRLPEEIESGATSSGFEGVTVTGTGADETVWLAQQREWAGDAAGTVKLLGYTPADKSWGAVRYPLEPKGAGWIGLSEITALGDRVVLIERDNLIGAAAAVKRLYAVPLAAMVPAPLGGELPTVAKTMVRDLLGDLRAPNGYVLDKVEGFAVDTAGTAFAVTDNDGVDDASGETQFIRLGPL